MERVNKKQNENQRKKVVDDQINRLKQTRKRIIDISLIVRNEN